VEREEKREKKRKKERKKERKKVWTCKNMLIYPHSANKGKLKLLTLKIIII